MSRPPFQAWGQSRLNIIESIAGNVTSRNETITNTIQQTHQNTLEYVRKAVGKTEADINSFFAQVKDLWPVQRSC